MTDSFEKELRDAAMEQFKDYNCMGIKHSCTYLSHVDGAVVAKLEAEKRKLLEERDAYKKALCHIGEVKYNGVVLPSVPHDQDSCRSHAKEALQKYEGGDGKK